MTAKLQRVSLPDRAAHGHELRQRLAAIIQFSDDALFSLSPHGSILNWNPAAHKIFGFGAFEAVGNHFEILAAAGHRAELQELLQHVLGGEHVANRVIECARKDGQTLEVAFTLSPIQQLSRRRVVGISVVARDVTQQKQAEEQLRISQAFYHSLVEHLPQNVFRKDLAGRFTFGNHRFCETIGKTLQEIEGKTDFDFFPPELAAKYQEDDRRVIEAGAPFETVEINQPPGGRKSYVNVCKTPIRDDRGRIIGVQGIFWDITESKEAEIGLRLSEERYRTLLGGVTDYIYTVEHRDGHPAATRHSPGCLAVTGYAPEDYERNPHLWYEMIYEEDRPAVLSQISQVLQGRAEPLEHRIRDRQGRVRWVRNTPVIRLNERGQLAAYDGLVSDITVRKLAEEQLRRTNADLVTSREGLVKAVADLQKSHAELQAAQMLLIRAEKLETVGRLAAGVAHEVKNPLAILLSGLDYLSGCPAAAEEDIAAVLKDMRAALKRADGVVRELLDFSAAQELGMNAQNLNELAECCLSLLRHDFARAGVKVTKELHPALPRVMLDRNKMEQVFLNLFINAMHAMPDGGALTVRTLTRPLAESERVRDAGQRQASQFAGCAEVVVVEVDDNGTGIAADKLPKIFDPFFTTKPTGQGTGLGLAVSRKIMEMHGAQIRLANRPEGGVRATLIFAPAQTN